MVTLELTGVDDAPGVKEGGVLEHVTHEVTVEALPTAIPDSITADVSAMDINDTVVLSAVHAPRWGHAARRPRGDRRRHAEPAPPPDGGGGGIEEETGLVGEEAEAAAEAEREGATADEAVQQGEAAGD